MSKKRNHKYFVNERYKQQLEGKISPNRNYWAPVKFITKEPDPRAERENQNRFWYYEQGLPVEMPDPGKNSYTYYDRPEVPYSIKKYETPSRYSKRRKYLCKQANKRMRRLAKQSDDVYQNGQYKKLYDVPWNLD